MPGEETVTEYRIIWRREGLSRRTRIYQTLRAAKRYALILRGDIAKATGADPDAFACCSGYECGCRGMTNAESWAEQGSRIPTVVDGPEIERRTVTRGPWLPVEEGTDHGGD